MNPLNIENRIRIESNYTTRSGERLIPDVSHDVASVKSGKRGFGKLSSKGGSGLKSKPLSKPLAGNSASKDFRDMHKNESPFKKVSMHEESKSSLVGITSLKSYHTRVGSQVLSPKISVSTSNKLSLSDFKGISLTSAQPSTIMSPKPAIKTSNLLDGKKTLTPSNNNLTGSGAQKSSKFSLITVGTSGTS